MSKLMEPTASQSRILDSVNKDILVSASAGTGKTTVMIEKIARLMLEKKATADELLVVTFTKLAAGEMKRRLKNKLSQYGAEFADQLAEIDNCDISTIHAFCANLARHYFYVLDIDPAFAIIDETEARLERARCMEEIFSECYEAQDEDFLKLAEVFSSGRKDDGLKDEVNAFYEFSVCLPDFEHWFEKIRTSYAAEDETQGFCAAANDLWRKKLITYKTYADEVAALAVDAGESGVAEFFNYLSNALDLNGKTTFSQTADVIRKIEFKRFCVFQGKKKEKYPEMAAKASFCFYRCKADIQKIQGFLDGVTTDEIQRQTTESFGYIDVLAKITLRFKQSYDKFKSAKGMLDYNDLEHCALRVLQNESALKQIRDKYKFVFVDEFQDTNEVQAQIVEKIKKPHSLFLVGDIKQSIYAFRQCRPQIFSDKLQLYDETEQGDVVFMNDNFRSNNGILSVVNKIFEKIMTPLFGALDYRKTSRLAARKCARTALMPVHIDFVRFTGQKKTVPQNVYDILTDDGKASFTHPEAEACVVAKRIKEIVGKTLTSDDGTTRPICFSDIVVLVRSGKEKTQRLREKLAELQIPVISEIKQPLFDCEELKTLINLLKVLDNPLQDIPLAAVMTGFFGGFSEQELIEISCAEDGEFFHERVLNAAENTAFALSGKLQKFFEFLSRLRADLQNLTLHQFLSRLLAQTDFLVYVSGLPNGGVRRAKTEQFVKDVENKFYDDNIKLFLEYAERWDDNPAVPASGFNSDAVRIMTIHQSKGLEFPVVFLCGAGNQFKIDQANVIYDAETGAGGYYYDSAKKTKRDTLARFLTNANRAKCQKEEEMRILYVALTRAENHLYIVGCKNTAERETKKQTAEEASTPLDWILEGLDDELDGQIPPAGYCADFGDCRVSVFDADALQEEVSAPKREFRLITGGDPSFTEAIRERLAKPYPHEFATRNELKASASKLSPFEKIIDDDDEMRPRVPVVFSDISVTELGTAYHKVFEIIDITRSNRDSALTAIEKIRLSGEFDSNVINKLDADLVAKVLQLPLFENVKNKKIYRELPFMLKTDASAIHGDQGFGETLFLQGVIDMLILDGNSAVIIDFKYAALTPAVREHYRKQLQSYALAARTILRCENVETYLVSIPECKAYLT